ncbi:hypothetical protein F5Y17DRAFT_434360 [Xylariaceae sp. FL0594]|nr:hypothetical protein F5Y17DRAFT_434360 [Xylariaceae sp. FL0594]
MKSFVWLASISFTPLVAGSPVSFPRAVTALNQAAFEEAQQTDPSATKAFADTLIKTADGRCLFVDELSGDFRANLTPVQIADCGSTTGQNWDIITNGKHNNAENSILVVNTLTHACLNFDPRRPAGNQVLLFSCGGRADGGGSVTDSQLFFYNGGAGPLSLSPENRQDSCMTVDNKGNNVIDVAACEAGDLNQLFTFGDALPDPGVTSGQQTTITSTIQKASGSSSTSSTTASTATSTSSSSSTKSVVKTTSTSTSTSTSTTIPKPSTPSPTLTPIPVSGAGTILQPSAVAESHPLDTSATFAFRSVRIRAPDGSSCLSVDPTAGDFRENLIPVSLVPCAVDTSTNTPTPNERFDIVTAGKHNNVVGAALVVSSLTNGCLSFDSRRQPGDTVTIFSCGGRADGGGQTNTGQLIPYTAGDGSSSLKLVLAPVNEANKTCIVPGNGTDNNARLVSAPCADDGSQVFTILTD